jgi:signal peptidase I
MSTLLIVAAFFAANLLLTTLFVWLGARLVKAPKATISRAAAAVLALALLNLILGIAFAWTQNVGSRSDEFAELGQMAFSLGALIVLILGGAQIIKAFMRASFSRAALIWLIGQIPALIGVAALYLVIAPFILELYVAPTNSMAPTIVSWHAIDACPHCGQPLFVSDAEPGSDKARALRTMDPNEREGICSNCLKTNVPKRRSETVEPPDRFACNKLMTPRRWDIVVFRYPLDPKSRQMKRLVGLPGEEVVVKEGSVWINGEKLNPPAPISQLQYVSGEERGFELPFATRGKPCKLQANEYFVLGDFSQSSSDSRYWGPLPGDHIEGIATLRYWPPSRFHIWR